MICSAIFIQLCNPVHCDWEPMCPLTVVAIRFLIFSPLIHCHVFDFSLNKHLNEHPLWIFHGLIKKKIEISTFDLRWYFVKRVTTNSSHFTTHLIDVQETSIRNLLLSIRRFKTTDDTEITCVLALRKIAIWMSNVLIGKIFWTKMSIFGNLKKVRFMAIFFTFKWQFGGQ